MFGFHKPPKGTWHVDAAVLAALSTSHPQEYGDFLQLQGRQLKGEKHTIIRLLAVPGAPEDASGGVFVLKQYNYSMLAQLRSWHRISKAEREYDALAYCHAHGIPAVQALGFGAQRSFMGPVRSCFIITRYESDTVSLRDLLRLRVGGAEPDPSALQTLVTELAHHLHAAHAHHFFFFSLLAKNILVRQNGPDRLEWLLNDQCYARRLRCAPLGAWAQALDIGMLLGSIKKYAGADYTETFFAAYLPDPLGHSETTLRRRVAHAEHVYLKQTPMRRISSAVESGMRHAVAYCRKLTHQP